MIDNQLKRGGQMKKVISIILFVFFYLFAFTKIMAQIYKDFNYKINDEIGRDFLVLGFFHEIFRKQNNDRSSNTELKDY